MSKCNSEEDSGVKQIRHEEIKKSEYAKDIRDEDHLGKMLPKGLLDDNACESVEENVTEIDDDLEHDMGSELNTIEALGVSLKGSAYQGSNEFGGSTTQFGRCGSLGDQFNTNSKPFINYDYKDLLDPNSLKFDRLKLSGPLPEPEEYCGLTSGALSKGRISFHGDYENQLNFNQQDEPLDITSKQENKLSGNLDDLFQQPVQKTNNWSANLNRGGSFYGPMVSPQSQSEFEFISTNDKSIEGLRLSLNNRNSHKNSYPESFNPNKNKEIYSLQTNGLNLGREIGQSQVNNQDPSRPTHFEHQSYNSEVMYPKRMNFSQNIFSAAVNTNNMFPESGNYNPQSFQPHQSYGKISGVVNQQFTNNNIHQENFIINNFPVKYRSNGHLNPNLSQTHRSFGINPQQLQNHMTQNQIIGGNQMGGYVYNNYGTSGQMQNFNMMQGGTPRNINAINQINATNSLGNMGNIVMINDMNTVGNMGSMSGIGGMNNINHMGGINCFNGMKSMGNINTMNTINSLNAMNGMSFMNNRGNNPLIKPSKKKTAGFLNPNVKMYSKMNIDRQAGPIYTCSSGNLDKFKQSGSVIGFGMVASVQPSKKKASLMQPEELQSSLISFLDSINEDLIDYVRTQKGSRNLQKFLTNISHDNLSLIFSKLNNRITDLMVDVYGNYLCQKLVTSCSVEQRVYIFNCISKDFFYIACHSSGTHALQSLISVVTSEIENEIIIRSLDTNVLKLAYDNNGTHVLQKIITCFNEESRSKINKVLVENITSLVNDINGVSVIKKFVNGNKSLDIRTTILEAFKRDGMTIVQNSYGNYIIQHVLKMWGSDACAGVVQIIVNNAISLSMQKFSSNVVEKCLEILDQSARRNMVREMFESNKICNLYKNTYGKFVLNKAFSLLTQEDKLELKESIQKKVALGGGKSSSKFFDLLELF